jgi:hypothetical protein
MSIVTNSVYQIDRVNLENSINSPIINEYISNLSDHDVEPNHCSICTGGIFMCGDCMIKKKEKQDDVPTEHIHNSIDNENGNEDSNSEDDEYDYGENYYSKKQKPNKSTEVWKNWTVIKDKSYAFTNSEYEYACFHNFSALRYIPLQHQTYQMIKLAFQPHYSTIYTDCHSGMSSGNSDAIDCNNYNDVDNNNILDCINPIFLDDNMCKYIFESGHWKAFCQYNKDVNLSNKSVQKYIEIAHQKLQNISELKESTQSKNENIILQIQKCKTIEELLSIYNWNNKDNVKYLPTQFLCLDTYIKMLNKYNDNDHVIQIAQNNNISKTDLDVLKVASICINRNFDVKLLEPYKNILTDNVLKYIVITRNSTTVLSSILHYVKSNSDNYLNNMILTYELIKSISTTAHIHSFFGSEYFTSCKSIFDDRTIFLTPDLELKLIKEMLAVDAGTLHYVNFSAKFSYEDRKYITYQQYTKNYLKKLNPKRQQYLLKNDKFINYCKSNELEPTIDVYEEYDSQMAAKKIINSYKFIDYCRSHHIEPTIESFNIIEKQNQQRFLEYFEIAKHAQNFWIKDIPAGMIELEGIKELCMKFVESDSHDLWYCNEYNNNIDYEPDNLDELYKKLLQLKTFNVFLLTKKYRNFDMYEISVNTYIKSLKRGENKNLYFYNIDSSYNPRWYNHSSWIDFFAGHNNLTSKELWLLARKLVASNGLFLCHITDNIRQLPEPYKSDIISIALEQNGMALHFCNRTFDHCVQAIMSCPSVYSHVKKTYKTIELLDLAIHHVLIK